MTTFGKELFIRFTAPLAWAFVNVCVCFFPFFVLRYGVWDLFVLIPDHYLSFYFAMSLTNGRGLAYTVFPEQMAPYVCYHGN